ncbi:MAG TPA: T9SS type A sorting domain-containing protein, partial [Prolixibacteraceae bacterium]|nr:T9SS type A sorting domain-containing protein [Prolixibacteraceae bacterium]
ASPGNARPWKPISILDSYNVEIEGICIANPAFHAVSLPWKTLKRKVTFVRWAKVISWRGNGDGIGNAHVMEDCFLRTQDDATYVTGDRRRLVIWNDANGSSFVQQGILDKFPIYVEDCDVIYARAAWHRWDGGRVFCGRPISGIGKKEVNVLFRDIRIEDPRPTLQIFNIHSKDDLPTEYNSPSGDIGGSFSGIKYQNITAVSSSILNFPEILHACEESPYSDLTFEDVVIDGKLFTKIDDFSFVNEWVTNITFNPEVTDDATLFDLYIDGVSMPEFKPDVEEYTVNTPFGTEQVPDVSATRMDYDAKVDVTQAEEIPGKAKILVTAEDGSTTKTYTVNFALGSDEITGFVAPEQVSPEEKITTTVSYSATAERDIRVFIQLNSPPWTNYGGVTVTVPMGVGEAQIDLEIPSEIVLAENAYKIVADLLPVGGAWPDRLDEVKIVNVDAVSISTNAEIIYSRENLSNFKVYPNPFENKLWIENTDDENVSIYNILGQNVYHSQNKRKENNGSLNTSSWQKGVYILRTVSNGAKMLIKQ